MRRPSFLIPVLVWLSVLSGPGQTQDRSHITIPSVNLVKPVDEAALSGLSQDQLCLLRNSIYARHGRRFHVAWIQTYFEHQSWYKPLSDYREPHVSAVEERNAEIIARMEHALPAHGTAASKNTHVPAQHTSGSQVSAARPSGITLSIEQTSTRKPDVPASPISLPPAAATVPHVADPPPAAADPAPANAAPAPTDNPTLGIVDLSEIKAKTDITQDAEIKPIVAAIAKLMKLNAVISKDNLFYNGTKRGAIDITQGVIALAKLQKGGDAQDVEDASVTAGPTVADPAQPVQMALVEGRYVRGNIVGYNGKTYRLKKSAALPNAADTADAITEIDKQDVLGYGVLVPPTSAELNDTPSSYATGTSHDLPALDMSKEVYVHGYFRKDGTYVRSHTRSAPGSGSSRSSRSGRHK